MLLRRVQQHRLFRLQRRDASTPVDEGLDDLADDRALIARRWGLGGGHDLILPRTSDIRAV
jgi:hypothetical protein